MDLDHVTAVSREGRVEERVDPVGVAALGDLAAVGVEQPEGRVEPALQPLGFQVEQEALAALAHDREAIDVGRPDLAVDDRVERDRVRLRGGVVRLGLVRLGPVADDDRARVAHAERPGRADVVMTDRRPRRGDDAEGQPLQVEGPQARVIEPERFHPVEVGPADRDVGRAPRGDARREDALDVRLRQGRPLLPPTLAERRPRHDGRRECQGEHESGAGGRAHSGHLRRGGRGSTALGLPCLGPWPSGPSLTDVEPAVTDRDPPVRSRVREIPTGRPSRPARKPPG